LQNASQKRKSHQTLLKTKNKKTRSPWDDKKRNKQVCIVRRLSIRECVRVCVCVCVTSRKNEKEKARKKKSVVIYGNVAGWMDLCMNLIDCEVVVAFSVCSLCVLLWACLMAENDMKMG
jgi:hypothetical protein